MAKGYGGRGSGIARKDAYGGMIPTIDPDYWWEHVRRLKVPPVRLPPEMTAAEFKERLEWQVKEGEVMTAEEFFDFYHNTKRAKVRRMRSQKERLLSAMEYFDQEEKRQWQVDQMALLETIVDQTRHEMKLLAYNELTKPIRARIKRLEQKIRKSHPEKLKDFKEAAKEYLKDLDERKKPKELQEGSKVVIRQARQYAMKGETFELRRLCRGLRPVLRVD